MTVIIDGKSIAQAIHENTKSRVDNLKKTGVHPKLGVVLVGSHAASKIYIRRKRQAAELVGIDFELFKFDADISKKELITEIIKIQNTKQIHGLIVQLPLPEPLYTSDVLNAICPQFDVDCLTDANIGKLVMNTNIISPPTPGAVLAVLDHIGVNVKGMNVAVLGAGALVGKPLSTILLNRNATVTTCNIHTKNIKKICKEAGIIVTAVGKRNLLTRNMVKRGTIVIDTGIVFENKKMYGDVDFDQVSKKTSYITPTPGGVGPITVALLLQNLITSIEKNK